MSSIWFGVLFLLGGLLFLAYQAIWRGRMSDAHRPVAAQGETLEPRKTRGPFPLGTAWPGLALVALGVVLLLAGTAF
ncbi:MAG TPA: hypothetical protein VEY95_08025 [Azospirillaceae bacterium]|nr:hypothetical protein [Azospirillaceae bacterium]